MCGEKQYGNLYTTTWTGSPPRVRGKGHGHARRIHKAGITPACAGKRALILYGAFMYRDHPRVCGEKENWLRTGEGEMGSPPRVRGKGA